MSFFTIQTVQSAVTCESGQAPSRKSVYFVQTDTIFHAPFTVLFTLYSHTVISVFCTSTYAFFVIDSTRKQNDLTLFLPKIYHQSVSQTQKL